MPPVAPPLSKSLPAEAIDSLVVAFAVPRAAVESAAALLFADLTRHLERLTLSRGGLADFVAMLGRADWAHLSLEPDALRSREVEAAGVSVLDEILGGPHQCRRIAEQVARQTTVSAEAIKPMLPALAALLMREVAGRSAGAVSGLAQALPAVSMGSSSPSFDGQSPLPLPGEVPRAGSSRGNPYGDLSDAIRRGGRSSIPVPGGGAGGGIPEGGSLWAVIRSILGQAMGFRSKGIVGWIVQYVLLRYGWQILQFFLRRMLGGR